MKIKGLLVSALGALAALFLATACCRPALAQFQVLGGLPAGSNTGFGSSGLTGVTLVNSTLFATTPTGGPGSFGSIISVNTDGSNFHTMYSFTSAGGDNPSSPLTAAGSRLWGVTQLDSAGNPGGSIYSINLDGTGFVQFGQFGSSGDNEPRSPLTLSGTFLYGTTNGSNGQSHTRDLRDQYQ
jgi:hypothetical protein